MKAPERAPERVKSTPRLIAIIITVSLVALTFKSMVEAKDFTAIANLILWYFFWSRWSEKADWKTEQELKYQIKEEIEKNETPIKIETDKVEVKKPTPDIDLPPYYPKNGTT